MKSKTILKLIASSSFIAYNKVIAHLIGPIETLVLGELCSLYEYFGNKEFFVTQERLSDNTAVSVKQIRAALEKLALFQIITITKKGVPCKNYYTVNAEKIVELLEKYDNTPKEENAEAPSTENSEEIISEENEEQGKLDVPNLPNWECQNVTTSSAKKVALLDNNKNNKINNNKNSKSHSRSTASGKDDDSKNKVSFKNSEYARVYDAYYENCKQLFDTRRLPVERPVFDIKQIKKLIKTRFTDYGVDAVVDAVRESIKHDWLISRGYPLSYILGPNEIVSLINKNYSNINNTGYQQKSNLSYQKTTYHVDLSDRYDMSDMADSGF